jgi:hypothetical protein
MSVFPKLALWQEEPRMFCRISQRTVLAGLGCAGLVVPARAAAMGESATTPAPSAISNAPSPHPSRLWPRSATFLHP